MGASHEVCRERAFREDKTAVQRYRGRSMLGRFEEERGAWSGWKVVNKAESYRKLKDIEWRNDRILSGLACSGPNQLLSTLKSAAIEISQGQTGQTESDTQGWRRPHSHPSWAPCGSTVTHKCPFQGSHTLGLSSRPWVLQGLRGQLPQAAKSKFQLLSQVLGLLVLKSLLEKQIPWPIRVNFEICT